jgi:hypothetical protein
VQLRDVQQSPFEVVDGGGGLARCVAGRGATGLVAAGGPLRFAEGVVRRVSGACVRRFVGRSLGHGAVA